MSSYKITGIGRLLMRNLGLLEHKQYMSKEFLKLMDDVAEIIMESKQFKEEFAKPDATFETTLASLGIAKMKKKEFETTFGIPFPFSAS